MTPATTPPPRDEADDDLLDALNREDALRDASGAVVAGLLGAALGAGLGWLASQALAGDSRAPTPLAGARTLRDGVRKRVRDVHRDAGRTRDRVDARAGDAADDVAAVARRTAEALERARADAERHLEHGLRDLRRAARRAARRIG